MVLIWWPIEGEITSMAEGNNYFILSRRCRCQIIEPGSGLGEDKCGNAKIHCLQRYINL